MNSSIPFHHTAYPPLLRSIYKAPGKLFFSGQLLDPADIYIAIVGTRHPSPYGEAMAQQFARELARHGFVIVSGLAYGIDAIAHEAALEHHPHKKTIAVMASGLAHIVPHSNRCLAHRITATGTLLTEYEADTPPHKGMFPARNRIIAGMSLATLVIEAPQKSGALITANRALLFNREVFTIPANLTQESSLGTNALIRDGLAHPVLCTRDILDILEPKLPPSMRSQVADKGQVRLPLQHLSEEESLVYEAVKHSATTQDAIHQATRLSFGKIAGITSVLELKGLVQLSGPYILTTR